MKSVHVIGGGLAGCEAAYQLAKAGVPVILYDMKPQKRSPAHHSDFFCELVCSNSLKSNEVTSACGLLKAELRCLDSLVIACADRTRVPAGGALAVDRDLFAEEVTRAICENPLITIKHEVVSILPEGICIVATGPLTDDALIPEIAKLCGTEFLHFFDAAAPIVTRDSIDFDSAFQSSRYGKGTDDYVNCPMTKEEYLAFRQALITAKTAEVKDFDKKDIFEGCMPIEVMAQRGEDTARFGPLKPVGLTDPHTGKRPYAVLQLRKENKEEDLFNLVGFQTHLTFGEQKRVFSMIPALRNAEFVRYGVMHRNTYLNAPRVLNANFQVKQHPDVFFAGQITGVEGYVESIASGLYAARSVLAYRKGEKMPELSNDCMIGALAKHVSCENENYQPMNANFGILAALEHPDRDKAKKKEQYAARALQYLETVSKELK